MKTWSAGAMSVVLAVVAAPAAADGIYIDQGGSVILDGTITLDPDATGESRGHSIVGTFAGDGDPTGQLPATLWVDMNYNQSGAVTTDHGGAIFGRVTGGANVQGFVFGVEGNAHCVSTHTTANCVGEIGHAVFRHDTSTPTATIIGNNARAEVTNQAISANREAGQVVAYRGESYGGDPRSRFGIYMPLSDNINVLLGPTMKIPPSTQTIGAGGTITHDGCGGIKQITAAGAVTTDTTNTFTAPSASTTSTNGLNQGCWMIVTNAGANTITLDANANFLTDGSQNVPLPSGASVLVVSNGSAWVQAAPVSPGTQGGQFVAGNNDDIVTGSVSGDLGMFAASSANKIYFAIGSTTPDLVVHSNGVTISSTQTATLGGLTVEGPAIQTIAAGNTITADGCGTMKLITSAGAVTTDTTNTFTAPSGVNRGCVMHVCNVGANNITLDNNANFKSAGGADVVMTADDCVVVGSAGASRAWYQLSALLAN